MITQPQQYRRCAAARLTLLLAGSLYLMVVAADPLVHTVGPQSADRGEQVGGG